MVDFVEHRWVVVFFRVVVETDHAILLVNASVDLTIFNLEEADGDSEAPGSLQQLGAPTMNSLTMCKTYFSASCGPESCTRLAMSCKDNVRKVCRHMRE